jgi:hypothetical protein
LPAHRQFGDQRLQSLLCGRGFSHLREPARRARGSPYPVVYRYLRSERERVPGKLGGRGDRSTPCSVTSSFLDLGRGAFVRTSDAEREVTTALDGVSNERAELGVHGADRGRIGFLATGCCQQWVIELNQRTSVPHDASRLRLGEPRWSADLVERTRSWARQQRGRQHCPTSCRGQTAQPSGQDGTVPLRDREILDTGRQGRGRPGKLDREIWVSARESVQCRNSSGCRHPAKPKRYNMSDLGFSHRADGDNCTWLGQQRRNAAVIGATHGRDDGEPLTAEATYREAEHTTSRRVQPLHIVQNQENRMPSRHHLEHLEDGEIGRERVGSISWRIGT